MPTERIRVLSVDDHPLLRAGIAAIVDDAADMEIVAQAASGREAVEVFRASRPDVTLMDLRMPDIDGIDAMVAIRAQAPEAKVIILTTFEGDAEARRALASGARGYLLKSAAPDDILDAIRHVHAGRKRIPPQVAATLAEHVADESLTGREREVLRLVADGNRNRDVAERLCISEETVKAHVKHVMEKLGANDRTQAVSIAVRRGIIQL